LDIKGASRQSLLYTLKKNLKSDLSSAQKVSTQGNALIMKFKASLERKVAEKNGAAHSHGHDHGHSHQHNHNHATSDQGHPKSIFDSPT